MLDSVLNTLRFSAQPGNLRVVAKKAMQKLRGVHAKEASGDVKGWCAERATSYADWARAQDPVLWAEATEFGRSFDADARLRLDHSKIRFGGGGAYALLYFLVRQRRPEFVVETGVAAGWSSAAILAAMERNGFGHLWSSDFPYFKQAGAADEIGVVVPESLRKRWTLLIKGDEANLPKILKEVPRVDMFHFDSDKTYKGRVFALAMVKPKLTEDAVIIFDDIQDNWHFRDIAGSDATVFGEKNKFVGALSL